MVVSSPPVLAIVLHRTLSRVFIYESVTVCLPMVVEEPFDT